MVSLRNKLLILFLLSYFLNFAQCPRHIVYYKGLFHYADLHGKVSKEGFPGWKNYDKTFMSNADSLSKLWVENRNDSLWLCTDALERLYNGKKWAVFSRDSGKLVSGFEFDQVISMFFSKNQNGTMIHEFSEVFMVEKAGRWGIISGSGNRKTTCVFEISDRFSSDWYVSPAKIGMHYNHGYYTLELKLYNFEILDEEGNNVTEKFMFKKP